MSPALDRIRDGFGCYFSVLLLLFISCRLFVSREYMYMFVTCMLLVSWFLFLAHSLTRFAAVCRHFAAFRSNITVVAGRRSSVGCWLRIVDQRRFVCRCGGISHLLGSRSVRGWETYVVSTMIAKVHFSIAKWE